MCTRSGRGRLEIGRQSVYSGRFGASVTLKLKVVLFALRVRYEREAAVVSLRTREHDSFCAQTAMHLEVFLLAPDKGDDVAAKQHFHFCVAVLEKLVLGDLRLVAKQVDLRMIEVSK